MHQALYRKWRPQTFDDVYGQEHITSILKYETEHGKFSHAYLFCGSRGTGKTTCAKILATALNCESPVGGSPCNQCASCRSIDEGTATDVLEMDAASNNGVDNIRDIRDEVVYTPSALRYRVYIVDEVHMLSGSAFNALLKTLEEPPSHVAFILATTELHKLPSTIVSRCQRFDFRRISTPVLMDRLAYIADRENIPYESEALRMIAKMAQGGMRDAISLLELCAGGHRSITPDVVNETLGYGGRESMEGTVRAIANADFDAIFSAVDAVVRSSKDVSVFFQELMSYYRDMLVIKTTANADAYLDLTEIESAQLKETAKLFSKETLLHHCRLLDEAFYTMQKSGGMKRTVAEMTLLKMSDMTLDTSSDAILSRLSKLETAVLSGIPMASATEPVTASADAKPIKEKVKAKNASKAEPEEKKATEQPQTEQSKPIAPTEDMLRVLRGWNEMAERASSGDIAILAFMRQGRAFTDADGRVHIRFPNDFAKDMVDRSPHKENIRGVLRATLQRELAESDVVFGILDGNEQNETDLDGLEL